VSLLLSRSHISSQVMLSSRFTLLYIPQVAVGVTVRCYFGRSFRWPSPDTSFRTRPAGQWRSQLGTGGGGIIGAADSLEVPSVPPKASWCEFSAAGPLKTGTIWESYLPVIPSFESQSQRRSATVFNGQVHVGESGTTAYYSHYSGGCRNRHQHGRCLGDRGRRDPTSVSPCAIPMALRFRRRSFFLNRFRRVIRFQIRFRAVQEHRDHGGYLIIDQPAPTGSCRQLQTQKGTFSTTATIRLQPRPERVGWYVYRHLVGSHGRKNGTGDSQCRRQPEHIEDSEHVFKCGRQCFRHRPAAPLIDVRLHPGRLHFPVQLGVWARHFLCATGRYDVCDIPTERRKCLFQDGRLSYVSNDVGSGLLRRQSKAR
jgi:hypothetical protein